MDELIETLRSGGYSCVIRNNGVVRSFSRRGVADLFTLLKTGREFLRGASVADRVVGMGAAAIMALGGVKELHAGVISTTALELLAKESIGVSFSSEVPAIRDREGRGFCPVETLCLGVDSPREMLPLIEGFLKRLKMV